MIKIDVVLRGSTVRTSLGSLGACGVYLITTDTLRILFDVSHNGRSRLLVNSLEALGIKPSQIDIVVLSHLHWDHALNINLFGNSKIIIDRSELIDAGSDDYARVEFLVDYIKKMDVTYPQDEQKIADGVTVIKTPGHTSGHISLAVGDSRENLLTGDALPNARAYNRGLPDLIFHSIGLAKQSIAKIKAISPKIIYPGHDSPFQLGPPLKHLLDEEITFTYRTETEEDYEFGLKRQKSRISYI